MRNEKQIEAGNGTIIVRELRPMDVQSLLDLIPDGTSKQGDDRLTNISVSNLITHAKVLLANPEMLNSLIKNHLGDCIELSNVEFREMSVSEIEQLVVTVKELNAPLLKLYDFATSKLLGMANLARNLTKNKSSAIAPN